MLKKVVKTTKIFGQYGPENEVAIVSTLECEHNHVTNLEVGKFTRRTQVGDALGCMKCDM